MVQRTSNEERGWCSKRRRVGGWPVDSLIYNYCLQIFSETIAFDLMPDIALVVVLCWSLDTARGKQFSLSPSEDAFLIDSSLLQ